MPRSSSPSAASFVESDFEEDDEFSTTNDFEEDDIPIDKLGKG